MSIRSEIANTYWHHFMEFPKFMPDQETKSEPDRPAAKENSTKALDGEILPPEPAPEKTPEEILVELRATRIDPRDPLVESSPARGLPPPSRAPDRGGPDLDR